MDLRDLEINSLKIALTTDNLCGVLRFGDYIFVVMEGINKNMGIRAQNIVDETQIMIEVSSLKHA